MYAVPRGMVEINVWRLVAGDGFGFRDRGCRSDIDWLIGVCEVGRSGLLDVCAACDLLPLQ